MTDLAKIRLLVTDIDGCWTDGRVWVDAKGYESCVYSKRDGVLLPAMREAGIAVQALTAERGARYNEQIRGSVSLAHGSFHSSRCEKLDIPLQLCPPDQKIDALMVIAAEHGTTLSKVAYLGDDLPDLPCLEAVANAGGAAFVPSGSPAAMRARAGAFPLVEVTPPGGEGALRRACETLLRARGYDLTTWPVRKAQP